MSVVTLKFVYTIALWLLCFCMFTETCMAQSAGVGYVGDTKDSIKKDTHSLKKSFSSKWTRAKKNQRSRIDQEMNTSKKEAGNISTTTSSLRKKTKKREINKNAKKIKTENDLSLTADTTKKNKSEKGHSLGTRVNRHVKGELNGYPKTVKDKLKVETPKEIVSEKFSTEKIEGTLQNKFPDPDYKMDSGALKKKAKGQSKNILNTQKNKITGNLGIKETLDPLKNGGDLTKHKSIPDLLKKQLTENIKGSVSVGYEYGILPYVSPDRYPAGAFRSEGRLSAIVFSLPVEISYRYTTIKSVIGINNYFRINYDASRYKEELDKKLAIKEQLKKTQLDQLHLNMQDIAMKMEYMKTLSNISIPEFSLPDTSLDLGKLSADLPMGIDSSKALSLLKKKGEYLEKKDSLMQLSNAYKAKYNDYKAKYDSLSGMIEKVKNGVDDIKNFDPKQKTPPLPFKEKLQEILKSIKKFEIGLCNPSYSLFLVSNAPLKGINMEYATKDHFFALTYGTTLNTILYNSNTLQGKLQGVKNLYNFFDYGNLSNGRKILAIKGGLGQKEDTHLFLGLLLGRGKMDYLTVTDPKYGKKESNLVVEIDTRYKISENLSVDAIFGKSSLQSEDISLEQIKRSFQEIFSNYRSNACQARVNYDIHKTKTKIQLTGRYVDPYFKSFGVAFLRSDNMRYELKADQTITRNIKYSVAYRKEEDNLLGLLNYKNTFTTITNSLSVRFKKGITLRLNYAPLLRTLKNGNETIKDYNSISTAVLSYVPKMKDVQANYNMLYSKYRITSDSGNIHFDNLTYSHQFQFKSGFKTGMNASWFENISKDTLNNNTYLGVVDMGYTTTEQTSFTIGGKVAYKPGNSTEFGFIAKATVKVYKSLFWETEAEKILTGDYYSSLIDSKINRFPYYVSGKLIINF